jgi:hypothetical protein
VEALARLRGRQGRNEEAVALWQKVLALRRPAAPEVLRPGNLAAAFNPCGSSGAWRRGATH